MISKKKVNKTKLLELTMRDVLGGLEDAATYMNYRSVPDSVEILSIAPAGQAIPTHSEVIQLNARLTSNNKIKRSTNIVDYLLQRELQRTA